MNAPQLPAKALVISPVLSPSAWTNSAPSDAIAFALSDRGSLVTTRTWKILSLCASRERATLLPWFPVLVSSSLGVYLKYRRLLTSPSEYRHNFLRLNSHFYQLRIRLGVMFDIELTLTSTFGSRLNASALLYIVSCAGDWIIFFTYSHHKRVCIHRDRIGYVFQCSDWFCMLLCHLTRKTCPCTMTA